MPCKPGRITCEKTLHFATHLSIACCLPHSTHPYVSSIPPKSATHLDSDSGLLGYSGSAAQAHYCSRGSAHQPTWTYSHSHIARTDGHAAPGGANGHRHFPGTDGYADASGTHCHSHAATPHTHSYGDQTARAHC